MYICRLNNKTMSSKKIEYKNMLNKIVVSIVLVFVITSVKVSAQDKIQWFSFEQALEMNANRVEKKLEPKKIFVDVYTTWCGWCKRLDATTFVNPEIIKYMSDNFIAVKLDAERKDTVVINNQMFINKNAAEGKRGTHDLAAVLLNGKMSYPSCTFIDAKGEQLGVIPGYMDAKSFDAILHFFGEDAYKTENMEEYRSNFKSIIK